MKPAIARLRNAISRHRGWRSLSWALAFAVMFVAWPQLELHAHAHGEQTHTHGFERHAHHHHQVPEDPDAAGVLHFHDASSAAWTLPSRPAQIAAVPLAPWHPALTFDSGALAARPPPQRPPIA